MSYNRRGILSHPMTHELLYRLIRLYSGTYRLTVENESWWRTSLSSGSIIILCTFHQQFFSAIRHFKAYQDYQPGLMISQSQDGDIIAGVAERSGWKTFRGSSSRGGSAAFHSMVQHVKHHRLCGHVVDGPRGPAGVIKMGIIRLAQLTGGIIVPFFVTVDRAWYFNSWDRFQLPKPFARVKLRFRPPVRWEKTDSRELLELQRMELENKMKDGLIFGN